ncbi:MAG: pre-peptidase C-terminal domain-containing protein [Kofleriaceae bacterium]
MSLLRNPILYSTLAALTMAACAESPADVPGGDEDGKADGTGETVQLENGVPVVISGIRDEARYFTIDVPDGQSFFTVTTRATDRDREDGGVDLYARFEAAPTTKIYDYGSGSDKNGEQLFVPATPGTWHILAFGYTPYDDVELTASFNATDAPRAWVLENGVPVEGVSASWSDTKPSFQIDVPPGKKNLRVEATWQGAPATIHLQNALYKSGAVISDASNSQATITVPRDAEGRWFITPDIEFLGNLENLRVVASYEDDYDQGVAVANGVEQSGINDAGPLVYRLDVPEGAKWVRARVAPGAGDSGRFQVRRGAKPTQFIEDLEGDFGTDEPGDLIGDIAIPVLEPGPVFLQLRPSHNGMSNTSVTMSYSSEVELPTSDIAFDSGDMEPPSPEIADSDLYGLIHEFEVFNFGTIKSVTVYLDIEHSYTRDLSVTLRKDGSLSTLLQHVASESRDWTAVYRLNDFNGKLVAGAYRLEISDSWRSDVGRVRNWRVVVERE